MKRYNGRDTLEIEIKKDKFEVILQSTQVRLDALDVIQHHINADLVVNEETVKLTYPFVKGTQTLASSIRKAKTRIEKLQLAQKLSSLGGLSESFELPFLHPEAIFILGDKALVGHFGLEGLLSPMVIEPEFFLKSYKALVLSVFNTRLAYEKLVGGSVVLRDRFSQKIEELTSIAEISEFIDGELIRETAAASQTIAFVPKGRYLFFKVFSGITLVTALVGAWFVFTAYQETQPRQEAIIAAQTDFLTANYSQTLTDLQNYKPAVLPKSARFVLAASSVNLTDLTSMQKQAILNNISIKSDDNTLNYWIYLGRGDFNQALNLAQNLGDDQLTLLAYTDLYQSTKLNTTMGGAKKQQLLDDYSKKISDLSQNLGK
ncbi:MAG: type VII secretion protein EssB [Streptococcaceae bacterium]|jgi:type VII secretion protein EssB|nr:type VII secretion protein EssB [Streptococcaceae bacterium]